MNNYFEADNIDDLYLKIIENVLNNPDFEIAPRGLNIKEKLNIVACLTDPTKNVISVQGGSKFNYKYSIIEKLEYLSGQFDRERDSYYNKVVPLFYNNLKCPDGNYAERLNYWHKHIYELLKADHDTRQAVMTIYGPQDRHITKDPPCTILHHYFIRNNKLYLTSYMRSNDLLWGFPYDVSAFCFQQEAFANLLGVELGEFTHIVGSMHAYLNKEKELSKFLENKREKTIEYPQFTNQIGFSALYANLNLFWHLEREFRLYSNRDKTSENKLISPLKEYFQILCSK